jgi:hypothetical protein
LKSSEGIEIGEEGKIFLEFSSVTCYNEYVKIFLVGYDDGMEMDMAKLSEKAKVLLLEETVLTNDIASVNALFAQHKNFEFTARAWLGDSLLRC